MRGTLCVLFGASLVGACDPGSATSIYTTDITSIEVHDMGGAFTGQPPPPGCEIGTGTMTVDVAAHTLTWDRCVAVGTPPNQSGQISSSNRALADAEWNALLPELEALVVVDDYSFCGVDTAQVIVTVKKPSATTDYSDSWHACQNRNKPLLDYNAVYDLEAALAALTQ